jgi:hypothetical protein
MELRERGKHGLHKMSIHRTYMLLLVNKYPVCRLVAVAYEFSWKVDMFVYPFRVKPVVPT